MPFAPPPASLFGASGPLEILQRMLASGGVQDPQQMQPKPPAAPTPSVAPIVPTGPVDPVAAELDKQIRADPVAQQNMNNPDYEDMLKAELTKQLENDNNPGRAIQKALAAAGAAISSGQDVWQGISTGVGAYHSARDDRSGRIGTLKTLSDMDREEADRPYKAEERALDLEGKRALIEERRSRAIRNPLAEARKTTQRNFDNKIKIDEAVERQRAKLSGDYSISDEDKRTMLDEYRQSLEEALGEGTPAPQAAPAAPQASPDTGGAPGQLYEHPETGQRVYWNGREWVDWQTGQPVGFGG